MDNKIFSTKVKVFCPLYQENRFVYIDYIHNSSVLVRSNGCDDMTGNKLCEECIKKTRAEFINSNL